MKLTTQSEASKAQEAAAFLKKKLSGAIPEIAVVLGSGFKTFSECLEVELNLPLAEIPHFQKPRVQGHGGNLVIGKLESKIIAVFEGRIHLYEGFTAAQTVFPVRVMGSLGVKKILLTNATGGLHNQLMPGDVLALKDQINLTGQSCLVGYEPDFGAQFVDMVNCFDPVWRKKIIEATGIKEGVYMGLLGPAYETPAETRLCANLGADVVGMSTVQETIAARQMGLKVAGLSLVTNLAGGLARKVDHQEVLALAISRSKHLKDILTKAVTASFDL